MQFSSPGVLPNFILNFGLDCAEKRVDYDDGERYDDDKYDDNEPEEPEHSAWAT